jgi:RNA polymerase sigma factor (sigma-70 family)
VETSGPETAAMLHAALEKLRPRQVKLLEAFHFDGKTLAEIAGELGISERAAEGRLRRAREALKTQFGAEPI